MLTFGVVVWTTLILAVPCSSSSVTIGLVLDDVSMINATDLNAAVAAINSDVNILSNITLSVNAAVLSSSLYAHKQLCDAASQGITTAISVTRCRNLPSVKSTFNNFNIPVINIGPEPCDIADDSVFTNIEAQLADMASFVRDLVVKAKWTRTHIFYDSTFSFAYLDKIQELLAGASVYTTLINIDTTVNLEATMESIYSRETEFWRYMIAASSANTLSVLDKASKKGLRDINKAWMIINPDVSYTTIQPVLDVLDNVAVVRRVNRKTSWMCTSPSNALNALVTAIAKAHDELMAAGTWVDQTIANCSGVWSVGDELMALTKVKIDAASICSNYTQYESRSSIFAAGGMTFTRTAKWNSIQGTIMTDNEVFPNAKRGYNGKLFNIETVPFSFLVKKIEHANGTVEYTGLTDEILKILSKNINFTYYYTEPADGYWGAPDDDGNWNGMVRDVMDGKCDMAAAAHTITEARASVIDFPDGYDYDFGVIMLKNPGAGSRLTVYIEPLHKWVWLCTFASMPICGFILYLLMKFSPFYTNQDKSHYLESVNLFKSGPCFWYIFGAFFTQGGVDMPKAMSTRFVLLVWWVFCLVMLATYAGNLIAFLTVTKVTLPVNSMDDIRTSGMPFGLIRGTAFWGLFGQSTSGATKRLWDAMDKDNQPDTFQEVAQEWVMEKNFIVIIEQSFYEGVSADNCEITKVPKLAYYYTQSAFVVPKGSPLKRLFSEQIQMLYDSGILAKLRRDWAPQQKCNGLTFTESKPMALNDTQGGFIVLGLGVGLAIFAFMAELIWYNCIRKKVEGKKLGPITFGSTESVSDHKVKPFLG